MGVPTVCLDFDGVCNTYDGWAGDAELFLPRPGLQKFISQLRGAGREVLIHSTRDYQAIERWVTRHGIIGAEAVPHKPPALCYVDDRGVRFNGSFDEIPDEVLNFKAFWEQRPEVLSR